MKVDAHIVYDSLAEVPDLVQAAERLGLDAVWFSETAHDPFLAATLAARQSSRITIGTAVAVAFTRSPTLLAHLAWDLAALSGGRFILGLGTQVKAHVVRRFGMPWVAPAPRLRETVQAVHAVWDAWRTGSPLDYRGHFVTLSLMTPFFTPPPHPHPIPVMTAGVNPPLCHVAGEVADGFLVHPFHTPAYLNDVTLPAIRRGRARRGRDVRTFEVTVSAFAVAGESQAEIAGARAAAKRAIAFYASTPSYRRVLAHHGWEDLGPRLSALAARGRWQEMADQISDEMLEAFAVVARTDDLGLRLRARYAGLADRISLYEPFPVHGHRRWEVIASACRG